MQEAKDVKVTDALEEESGTPAPELLTMSGDGLWERALDHVDDSQIRLLRLIVDLSAVSCAISLAFLGRFYFHWLAVSARVPGSLASHVLASGVWCVSFIVAAAGQQLYDEDTTRPEGGEFPRLVRAALEAGAVLAIFVFISQSFSVSRSWFGMLVVFTVALVVLFRSLFERALSRRRSRGQHQRPVVIVAEATASWPDALFTDALEFRPIARLTKDQVKRYLEETGKKVMAGARRRRENPTLLLKATDFEEEEMWELILDAGLVHCPVFVHSDVRAVGRHRLVVREVANNTLFKIAPPRMTGLQALTKRVFDLIASIIFLVALSPLFLVIALAVLVGMGWPIFFVQDRAGKDGRPFRMLKFRTMSSDAEAPDKPIRAVKDDPRRTPLGRVLRRLSLDELPQLFNVLVGDMSLVGPRPEMALIASGLEQDIRFYGYRHRIRPGITGWAQAKGLRGDTSIADRVDFDNWYIEHWSLALDLRILLRTFAEIARGENAY
jgi:exopolysaccharide biosynthesis polyprenyl glycosylphosphotransferase